MGLFDQATKGLMGGALSTLTRGLLGGEEDQGPQQPVFHLRRFDFQHQQADPVEPEPYYDYHDILGDHTELGYVVLHGDADGAALDIGNSRIVNISWPSTARDLASKEYVDFMAYGPQVHPPVEFATTGPIDILDAPTTIDGGFPSVGDRILVKNQVDARENGYYVFEGVGVSMVRAADGVNPFVNGGAYCFVMGGMVNQHTAWVLYTDPPISIGTTPLDFEPFTGLGQVVAGLGLTKTGNQIDVGQGDGIDLQPNSVGVALDFQSALEFSGVGRRLTWLPDQTRGLSREPDGGRVKLADIGSSLRFTPTGDLDLKLDAVGALATGADGLGIVLGSPDELFFQLGYLRVSGVPTGFMIDGVATGPTVTPANLATLTAGLNADDLHTHNSALETSLIRELWTAQLTAAKGQGVYISSNGRISGATSITDPEARIIGVADESILPGATGMVTVTGKMLGVLGGEGITNVRYFLGNDGQPAPITLIPKGNRLVQVGIAINENDLFIQVHDYGRQTKDYTGLIYNSSGELVVTTTGQPVTTF